MKGYRDRGNDVLPKQFQVACRFFIFRVCVLHVIYERVYLFLGAFREPLHCGIGWVK